MNKKFKTFTAFSIIGFFAVLFLFPTVITFAQGTVVGATPDNGLYRPLVTLPGLFKANTPTNPVQIISGVYGIAIGIASVIGTIMIIYAGFEYMYVESITGKSDARKRITNVFTGLLVILGSYILLRTINPQLVEFDLILPGGTGKLQKLVASDKESQISQAALARINDAANQLGNSLKTAEGIMNDVAALKTKQQVALDLIAKLKASGKPDTDPEIQALSAQAMSLDDQIAAKTQQATDITNLAKADAYKTSLAETANMTLKDLNTYSYDRVQSSLNNLSERTNKALALIDNTNLSSEEKAKRKSEILNASSLEKVLLRSVSDVQSALSNDYGQTISTLAGRPAISDTTMEKFNAVQLNLSKIISEVKTNNTGVYSDPAQKQLVISKIQEAKTGLQGMIDVANQNASNSADKTKLVAAVTLATGPLGGLACYWLCN